MAGTKNVPIRCQSRVELERSCAASLICSGSSFRISSIPCGAGIRFCIRCSSRTIGRRTLAASLSMTERVLRAETDFLKEQGFLDINSSGMRISPSGRRLLEEMEPVLGGLLGLSNLEEELRSRFKLQRVVIVPGDSDTSDSTKRELGRAGAAALLQHLGEHDVVAVTGGTTLAQVAAHLTPVAPRPGNLFVPARGGLGESWSTRRARSSPQWPSGQERSTACCMCLITLARKPIRA